jgi:ABC-type Fe3+-hydroxamate transport system substrate-binding protein
MQNVEIVVSGTRPDEEAIIAIQPDLIMYDKALYSDDEIAKIKQMGFETIEYDVETIDDYADFGYRLGAKLSMEMTMSRYLDKVYQAVAAAVVHQTTKPRTTLLLGDGKEGNYLMMGKAGFHSQLFSTCGATPVGVEGKMFQEANIERLIDMDPEIIYSDGNAQSIYGDARLQAVAAVKNQRVYDFDAKDIVRIGAMLDKIIERIGEDVYRMPVNPRVGATR